jgi:hypothetical protein
MPDAAGVVELESVIGELAVLEGVGEAHAQLGHRHAEQAVVHA